jgi:hypothetical protein
LETQTFFQHFGKAGAVIGRVATPLSVLVQDARETAPGEAFDVVRAATEAPRKKRG